MPAFMLPNPPRLRSWRTERIRSPYEATIEGVSSFDASSSTMTSVRGYVCRSIESNDSRRNRAPLYTGTTMLTSGSVIRCDAGIGERGAMNDARRNAECVVRVPRRASADPRHAPRRAVGGACILPSRPAARPMSVTALAAENFVEPPQPCSATTCHAFDTDCRTLSTIPGPLRNSAIDAGCSDGSCPVGRDRVGSPHRG